MVLKPSGKGTRQFNRTLFACAGLWPCRNHGADDWSRPRVPFAKNNVAEVRMRERPGLLAAAALAPSSCCAVYCCQGHKPFKATGPAKLCCKLPPGEVAFLGSGMQAGSADGF